MIVIGGLPTGGGFKDFVWVIVGSADGTEYVCTQPRYADYDVVHLRRESAWRWYCRNWTTVRVEEQEVHNREELYMQLWEHTDRLGILQKTQLELADIIGIPYQRLSVICAEYQKAGYVKKYRHKFQMKNPDRISADDWADFMAARKSA